MPQIAAFAVNHAHLPRLVAAAVYDSPVHVKLLLLYAGQRVTFTTRQMADVLLLARKSRVKMTH